MIPSLSIKATLTLFMQLNLIRLTYCCTRGTSPMHAMPLMHVVVVYTTNMTNLMTFAQACPAQMIFINTSWMNIASTILAEHDTLMHLCVKLEGPMMCTV